MINISCITYTAIPKVCCHPHYLWKVKVPICDKLYILSTFSRSIMVSVGILKLGLTDLIFVDLGVKINGGYYRDTAAVARDV